MAIIDVIKYGGTPSVLAWKHPNSELGTWTQVIVNESQEAILFKGGQALDILGPGRHTLETANIPLLNNIINLPFGGRSPFSAEIWYVNKVNSLDIKWGTPTPIQIQDPKYNVFIPVRAFGQFGVRVVDSRKFLTELVGTLPSFTTSDVIKFFRGAYLTEIKDDISKYLIKQKISILEINAYISEISNSLKESVSPTFDQFGIKLLNFYVNDISVPEDDTAVKVLKDALSKKAEMDIVGYSYSQERSFDTLEGAATNEGSGSSQFLGAGLGIGMGVGIGGKVGNSFGELGSNIDTSSTKKCPHCHNTINSNNKFCPECGKDTTQTINSVTCQKCGTQNKEGLKFCGECGSSLVKLCRKCSSPISDNQKFCSNCGTPVLKKCTSCDTVLADGLKFCPVCGKKVEDNAE